MDTEHVPIQKGKPVALKFQAYSGCEVQPVLNATLTFYQRKSFCLCVAYAENLTRKELVSESIIFLQFLILLSLLL